MKNIQSIVFVGVVLSAVAAGFLLMKRQPAGGTAPATFTARSEKIDAGNAAPPVSAPATEVEAAPPAPPVSDFSEIPTGPGDKSAMPPSQNSAAAPSQMKTAAVTKTPAKSPTIARPRAPKEPVRDPVAREALYFVGADPRAEEYWFEAINDPGLSAHERKDLIEDLNEDGLPDPKHPTPDDLPLIVSRIRLIEAVGMDAMDKVNADAFQEAYKDLVNLAYVAMGDGSPVK